MHHQFTDVLQLKLYGEPKRGQTALVGGVHEGAEGPNQTLAHVILAVGYGVMQDRIPVLIVYIKFYVRPQEEALTNLTVTQAYSDTQRAQTLEVKYAYVNFGIQK